MLTSSFSVSKDLVYSPRELLDIYFHGINIPRDKQARITDETLEAQIRFAQRELEDHLGIKLAPQLYKEKVHFYREDWAKWGRIGTQYPVRDALSMIGLADTTRQIIYPSTWLVNKENNDEIYERTIYVLPIEGSSIAFTTNSVPFTGAAPQWYARGRTQIPTYWTVEYLTGFKKIPASLANAVGKIAAINLFNILGDIVIGAGIASQSVGFGGLSQSISTTSSAENSAYSARIKQYLAELKEIKPILEKVYGGIDMAVL